MSGSPLAKNSFSEPRWCETQSRSGAWYVITTPLELDRTGAQVRSLVTCVAYGICMAATHWEGGEYRLFTYTVGGVTCIT